MHFIIKDSKLINWNSIKGKVNSIVDKNESSLIKIQVIKLKTENIKIDKWITDRMKMNEKPEVIKEVIQYRVPRSKNKEYKNSLGETVKPAGKTLTLPKNARVVKDNVYSTVVEQVVERVVDPIHNVLIEEIEMEPSQSKPILVTQREVLNFTIETPFSFDYEVETKRITFDYDVIIKEIEKKNKEMIERQKQLEELIVKLNKQIEDVEVKAAIRINDCESLTNKLISDMNLKLQEKDEMIKKRSLELDSLINSIVRLVECKKPIIRGLAIVNEISNNDEFINEPYETKVDISVNNIIEASKTKDIDTMVREQEMLIGILEFAARRLGRDEDDMYDYDESYDEDNEYYDDNSD